MKQADEDLVIFCVFFFVCFINFFYLLVAQRFGKDTGIFYTPKLRAQGIPHPFIKSILCPTLSGKSTTKIIRHK